MATKGTKGTKGFGLQGVVGGSAGGVVGDYNSLMTTQAEGISLEIGGMTCGACAARVDRALRSVKGVREAAVNLTTNTARVQGDVRDSELVSAIENAGYTAKVTSAFSARAVQELESKGEREEGRVRS